jgi:hypothetical protein
LLLLLLLLALLLVSLLAFLLVLWLVLLLVLPRSREGAVGVPARASGALATFWILRSAPLRTAIGLGERWRSPLRWRKAVRGLAPAGGALAPLA